MWLTTNFEDRMEEGLLEFWGDQVELAIVYEPRDGGAEKPTAGERVRCYPVQVQMNAVGLCISAWPETERKLLEVIEDFRPDIIHVFGSEWVYGAIAEKTSVPVTIHMMGFLNIYHMAVDMVLCGVPHESPAAGAKRALARLMDSTLKNHCPKVFEIVKKIGRSPSKPVNQIEMANDFEMRLMQANRYFMGRTDWDRNIVKYYAPQGKYYHVPEAMRKEIWQGEGTWRYHYQGRLRLLTISCADYRKGNEIILRTALLLKNLLHMDFEWKVAGSRDFFPYFEERTQLHHQDLNIDLIGYIDADRVRQEMQEADFFVHPSIVDNSPRSICEAQLVGCPVVASNVGGVPQLIEDGRTGFLYPYNEPHTLAFLLGNLYQDGERLAMVSRNAAAVARERHDPHTIADILLHTYEEIIAKA